jgi:hypothetical protein
MKTIKNIAAFPLKHSEDKFNPGMTLRDYFAGQIITGVLSNTPLWNDITTLQQSADFAYELADALLIQRQKYEPKDNR